MFTGLRWRRNKVLQGKRIQHATNKRVGGHSQPDQDWRNPVRSYRGAHQRVPELLHQRATWENETWSCGAGTTIWLVEEIINKQNSEYRLRAAERSFYRNMLLFKPVYEKVLEIVTEHDASNHFLRNDNYTQFAEWRFVHRARLNVVPLDEYRRQEAQTMRRFQRDAAPCAIHTSLRWSGRWRRWQDHRRDKCMRTERFLDLTG